MIFAPTRRVQNAAANQGIRPCLRDLFISEPQNFDPVECIEQIVPTIDLVRCFTYEEVLYVEPSTGHFRLKETFRRYIENIDHWTLDRKVADLFPQMKGKIKFR